MAKRYGSIWKPAGRRRFSSDVPSSGHCFESSKCTLENLKDAKEENVKIHATLDQTLSELNSF